MQRHPQGSEASNEIRRRREEFTVAIRRQNRQRIFSKKRFRSVFGSNSASQVEHRQITRECQGRHQNYNQFGTIPQEREKQEWEREGEDNREVEVDIFPQEKQLSGQSQNFPYSPQILSLSQRAEQLYGLKPYLRITTLQSTSIRQNVALDDDLTDFIQDVLDCPYSLQSLDEAIDCLRRSEDELSLHRGAILIRKIVAHYGQVQGFQWIVVKLVDEGVLPILAGMVQQEKHIHLTMEAAWILSNIVAAEGYTQIVAEMLNMELLFKLLAARSEIELVLSLCWLIGNITCEIGQQTKHKLLSLGAVNTFKNIAESTQQRELFDACCWNMANLFRDVDAERYRKELAQAVELICKSVSVGLVNEFFVDSINSLRALKTTHLECMARSGVIAYLVSTAKQEAHLQQETYKCMAQFLNDFAQGNELMCQMMLDCGILDLSEMWLRSGDEFFIEEALRMLSNIAASNTSQCLRILNRTELMHLAASMLRHKDENLRQQACILFINVEPYGMPTTVFNVYRNVNILSHAFFILQDHNPGEYEKEILIASVLELIQHVLENGAKETNLLEGENLFLSQMRDNLSDRWGIDWEFLLVSMADDPSELIRTRVDKTLGDFFPRQRGWPERERSKNENQQRRKEDEDELL